MGAVIHLFLQHGASFQHPTVFLMKKSQNLMGSERKVAGMGIDQPHGLNPISHPTQETALEITQSFQLASFFFSR